METTVPFWDTESLTIEIIKHDLIYQSLINEVRADSHNHHHLSSLHESVCWLLGISEGTLQWKFAKHYLRQRKKSSESGSCITSEAKRILREINYSSSLNNILQLQMAYEPEPISVGIDKLILNLIKNDFMYSRLLHESNSSEKVNHQFDLVEPIMWLCLLWDIKVAKRRKRPYLRMKHKASGIEFSKFNKEFESLAKATFRIMKKTAKKSQA